MSTLRVTINVWDSDSGEKIAVITKTALIIEAAPMSARDLLAERVSNSISIEGVNTTVKCHKLLE